MSWSGERQISIADSIGRHKPFSAKAVASRRYGSATDHGIR